MGLNITLGIDLRKLRVTHGVDLSQIMGAF